MSSWTNTDEYELSRENLGLLLDNRIPVIRIPAFATPAECERFAAATRRGNMQYYDVSDRIGYIGLAQYQYRWSRTRRSS